MSGCACGKPKNHCDPCATNHQEPEAMSERNYAAERKQANIYATQALNAEPNADPIQWVHVWGMVYTAYLAGLRGKKSRAVKP